jgi:hypothetical protein
MVKIIEAILPTAWEQPKIDHAYEKEHVERHNKQESSLIECYF